MKFFAAILLTALTAFACGLYLPWWSFAVAAFIVSLVVYQRPITAFVTGFLGVLLLWLILLLSINYSNDYILAPKVSILMGFGESIIILLLITCLIGSLTGGLAALTGSLLRRII